MWTSEFISEFVIIGEDENWPETRQWKILSSSSDERKRRDDAVVNATAIVHFLQ